MADTAYVYNTNGVEIAPVGDSFVHFLPEKETKHFEKMVEDFDSWDEAVEYFDSLTVRNVTVGRLIAIAEFAQAVLDSECGVQSLHELAKAIEAADFVGDGYYTSLYTGAAEEDEA
jgi:hypothetical protein